MNAGNIRIINSLQVVVARWPAAEFGGVGSGLAGEFDSTIPHLFFSMATQFDNYQHRNHIGVSAVLCKPEG